MTPSQLAILVPVLRRPKNVARVLNSALTAVPSARVLFICDPDDEPEIQAIKDEGGEFIAPRGNYAGKINAGIVYTTEPLIFTGADDIHFHPGWFETAMEKLVDGVGLVGTNDLCNERVIAGQHATHFLMTREYAERGTIDDPSSGPLHEGYPHEYVDNELIETAKYRKAYAHAGDAIVEHLHPMVGKAPMDDLYAQIGARMNKGCRIYRRRKHLWA